MNPLQKAFTTTKREGRYIGGVMYNIYVTFLGYHNWLQSDAAFVYPRLDSTAWAWECFGLRAVCHVVHQVA